MEGQENEQELKQVIHHTTGNICNEIEQESGIIFSKQAIATLSEICHRQSTFFAQDLESFTQHARRKKVSPDDVLMLTRKVPSLYEHLKRMKT